MNTNTIKGHVIYECGICECCHPWHWNGDCRDDANRFNPEDYAIFMGIRESDLDIRDMTERVKEDKREVER